MMVKVLLSLDDYLQSFFIVFLGLEPGAAEYRAQMNPLSYGGTPSFPLLKLKKLSP